jgi:hypothetical protein
MHCALKLQCEPNDSLLTYIRDLIKPQSLVFQKSGDFPMKQRTTKDEFKAMRILLRLLQVCITYLLVVKVMANTSVPPLSRSLP